MDNGFAEGYAVGQSNGNNGNGAFGWGGDWIWAFLLFALFGYGNNGFGGGYGNGSVGAEVQRGFDTQSIISKLDGLSNGLCDGFYAQNTNLLTGFSGVQQTLSQGFSGINTAIERQGYESRLATKDLSSSLSSCCCDLKSAIGDLKYTMAADTCSIKQAIADNTQAVIGWLTNEKISGLQAENAALRAEKSNAAQSQYLIDKLRPCPIPAYQTCNPWGTQAAYGSCGSVL